jgi:hypothetical protein
VWALSAALPLASVAAVALLVGHSTTDPAVVLFGAAAMAVAGFISVPGVSGGDVTAAYAVAAALPFLAEGERALFDLAGSLAVVVGGLGLIWLARTLDRRDPRDVVTNHLRRTAVFAVYLLAQHALAGLTWPPLEDLGGWRPVAELTLAAGPAVATEVLLAATLGFRLQERGRRYTAYLTLRDLDVFASLLATGGLFGLAFRQIGWWAVVVAGLPYAFAHAGFRRLQAAKTTYAQTMRALAQIPEVALLGHPGHSARTADLALAVARDLGLRPSEVEEVEFTALMHDIGRVTLNEPGIVRRGFTEHDLAGWGAEIVGETAYLAGVAEAVRRQYEPYRHPGEPRDPDVPLAARLVKVISAYDEATAELGASPLEALERLHRGSVYDYDPDVVATLRRVLELRGAFSHPVARG